MKSWEEIKALFAETDRRFKETDRKFQETDRKFQETDRRFRETEAQMRETDRKMLEVFERFDNLSRRFDDLGSRLDEFVESMVEPALVELYRARGLDVSEVYRRVTSRRGGERIEIALLVTDSDVAVALKCRSHLTREEVERHVERMNKFKRLLPKGRWPGWWSMRMPSKPPKPPGCGYWPSRARRWRSRTTPALPRGCGELCPPSSTSAAAPNAKTKRRAASTPSSRGCAHSL
jgi:hypothetical protein